MAKTTEQIVTELADRDAIRELPLPSARGRLSSHCLTVVATGKNSTPANSDLELQTYSPRITDLPLAGSQTKRDLSDLGRVAGLLTALRLSIPTIGPPAGS